MPIRIKIRFEKFGITSVRILQQKWVTMISVLFFKQKEGSVGQMIGTCITFRLRVSKGKLQLMLTSKSICLLTVLNKS